MRFNSQSVLMHKGVNHRVPVTLPQTLIQYQIADEVWEDAVKEFNQRLDKRPHVTMKFFLQKNVKVDILRIHRMSGAVVLWVFAKGDEVGIVDRIPFTLRGEVIFAEDSDTKVDKMVIQDIMYSADDGIFSENS